MEILLFVLPIAAYVMAPVMLSLAECVHPGGCVALAYYTFNSALDGNLTSLASRFQANLTDIMWYSQLKNTSVEDGHALHIPFQCGCASGGYLAHNFSYAVFGDDDINTISSQRYEFLSSMSAISAANPGVDLTVLFPNNVLTIPVNCSCGDPKVSLEYGLFLTYVATEDDNPDALQAKFNISADLLQSYNENIDLNILFPNDDILYIPAKDGNGSYPPFNSIGLDSGSNKNVVIGASVGSVVFLMLLIKGVIGFFMYTKKKKKEVAKFRKQQGPETSLIGKKSSGTYSAEIGLSESMSTSVPGFVYDRSVEFTYDELSVATNDFSIASKIGQGGFGSVYYGEIRGQKLAIKRMNMQATREFLAELQVLTRVHHTNLVSLVGYCTVEALFLVYEYVENGTLSQHLKHSRKEGGESLSWPKRVQIALDAARGLEYIHEHTTPTYIHRDIKSDNILLDNNFRAKVADFGLTKLTKAGSGVGINPSRLVGTFGYIAPEYARFGDVSSKSDVYSFGVVLFEIISAKAAIVHGMENLSEDQQRQSCNTQCLVNLFKEALADTVNSKEKLRSLVDPALGDDYPIESVWKMANLANACTKGKVSARPNMRVVVVSLMTLSSSSQDWGTDPDVDAFMTGR